MSNTMKLLCLTYILLTIVIIVVVVIIVKKHNRKKYGNILDTLEREKNLIINANILSELNKVESMINSKDMENKYAEWKRRFDEIKNVDIPALTDSLIEIEDLFKTKKYKQIESSLAKVELSIYHVKTKANYLLEEIKNITLSEERNRETITKLKGKYRNVVAKYHENELSFALIKKPVELQFETIDKLFSAFEIAMEQNSFSDVAKIIKALDDSINNLDIVIDEAPDIILMGIKIVPKKMEDVNNIYNKMVKSGYNLDYLNIEYNINEAQKKIADIFDRLNVLNLEDSILELKTISEYFDNIYTDFDKEKTSKNTFSEIGKSVCEKITKMKTILSNLLDNIDTLLENYIIDTSDLDNLNTLEVNLKNQESSYNILIDSARNRSFAFSRLSKEMELLNTKIVKLEDNLDVILKVFNGFKEDEQRAHDELNEITNLLISSKEKINSYKLPVIPKKYYIELSEATEAINEMIKEMEKKPLNIDILNTRVDTARDLSLKLYKTTDQIVQSASMSEHAIVYGNRYRAVNPNVDAGLKKAEQEFYEGSFKSSLEHALSAINIVEPGIHEKLLKGYRTDKQQ